MHRPVKHLSADERRTATVEVVIELAAEQNPCDITTAAIAKRMGLTQGALFRHFANKEAILQAAMEWVTEQLLARLDKAVQTSPSANAILKAMFMAHMEFIVEHPGVPRIVLSELQRTEQTAAKGIAQALIGRYSMRLQHLLEQGKTADEFDVEVDTAAAATLFIGTIQGLVMASLLTGDVNRIRLNAPKVYAIYQQGIRRKS